MTTFDDKSEKKLLRKLKRPKFDLTYTVTISAVVIAGLQLTLAYIYIDANYKSALYQGQIETIKNMSKIIAEQIKYIRLCETKGLNECSKKSEEIIDKMTLDGIYISDAMLMPAKITALRFNLYDSFGQFLTNPTCNNARNYLIVLNGYLDSSRSYFTPDLYSRRDMLGKGETSFIELYTFYNSLKCNSFLVDPDTEGYLSSLPPNWMPPSDKSLLDNKTGFERIYDIPVMKMPN